MVLKYVSTNIILILFCLQITEECPTDLHSLNFTENKPIVNETTGDLDLDFIYKAAILFSAHFRYMAEDWLSGRSCLDPDLNQKMTEAYQR